MTLDKAFVGVDLYAGLAINGSVSKEEVCTLGNTRSDQVMF